MEANETRRQGVLTAEIEEAEKAGEAPSLASVWKCPGMRLPDANRHSPDWAGAPTFHLR
jgi:hypothetical protein